jgi:hypothetical protein
MAGMDAPQSKSNNFQQLRALVDELDADGNGRLSFLEWACLIFEKKVSQRLQV